MTITEPPATAAVDTRFAVAIDGETWHAVDLTHPRLPGPGPCRHFDRWSACDRLVKLARNWQSATFDDLRRTSLRVCPTCVWMVALRTGRLEDELTRLDAALAPAPLPARTVVDVARTIVAAAAPDGPTEDPDLRAVDLLTTLTLHTPEPLVDLSCSEGNCDHDPDRPGGCPVTEWACPTCSLRAGPAASDGEGEYELGGVVEPPCSVLAVLNGYAPRYFQARRG